MNLSDFNILESNNEKAEAVWEHGVQIASRQSPIDSNVSIILYQLPKFYVEIYYNNNDNKIVRFLSFFSVENLEPYLNSISISDLI